MKTLHPYLLATFPIIYLYITNTSEVSPSDVIAPIGISLGVAVLLLWILGKTTKNVIKSALTVSTLLPFFYFYSQFTTKGLLPLWIGLLAMCIILIWRAKRNLTNFNRYMSIISIMLIAISLSNLATGEIRKAKAVDEDLTGKITSPENPRDIYYIIPDSYGSTNALQEVYGFDNSEFIDYLESKGFYIASESHSNYSKTTLSLPSSLSMCCFKPEWRMDTKRESEDNLVGLITNSEVSRLLKSVGYEYAFVSSGFFHDEIKPYAEVYKTRTIINNFTTYICWNSAISPLMSGYIVDSQRDRILYAFDTLENFPDYKEPVFVLAHILCPHSPTIFNRDGSIPDRVERLEDDSGILRASHPEQVMFVNDRIERIVEFLLNQEPQPIIILQGDHENGGKVIEPYVSGTSILNAYYLPDGGDRLLYDNISPVNTFRVIFNYYFGADYELLEDKSYCVTEYPYEITIPSECGRCK